MPQLPGAAGPLRFAGNSCPHWKKRRFWAFSGLPAHLLCRCSSNCLGVAMFLFYAVFPRGLYYLRP